MTGSGPAVGVAGHGSSVTRYTHRQQLGKDSVGRDRFLLLWSRAGGFKWIAEVEAAGTGGDDYGAAGRSGAAEAGSGPLSRDMRWHDTENGGPRLRAQQLRAVAGGLRESASSVLRGRGARVIGERGSVTGLALCRCLAGDLECLPTTWSQTRGPEIALLPMALGREC